MAENKIIPEIRFAGFTNPWEQRKLGEVGKARSGVDFPDVEQGGTSGTPFFKVSDMNNAGNENEMNVANNYVTNAQMASRRWSPIEELPAIFFAKVGAAVMLNRKRLCRFPFLLDNNTMAYSLGKDMWDADFAKALFETVDLTSLVQVGALPSYNSGDVEAMEKMFPEVPEQQQIGLYFRLLDSIIILYKRKYEQLRNVKKSMLEKMFPRDGADVPEIRFAGFTDAWERRKVGEVITEVSRPIEMKDDQIYQLVTVKRRNEGIVSRGFFYGRDILVKNYYEIHTGDYLISKRQLVHGANGQVPEILDKSIVSNEYMVCVGNEALTAEFLTLLSKTDRLKKDFFLSSYGVDIEKLVFDVNDWKKRSLVFPRIDEQNAICGFFNNLDNLITLHQRKCEQLVQIKKSMLEKMFV